MNHLLEVTNVSVKFGGVDALQNVSLTLQQGELLGLIGPNGAGKSTLMRVIIGHTAPKQGSVSLAGKNLNSLPTEKRIRAGLGLSQQLVKPFRNMSLLENVTLTAGNTYTRNPITAFTHVNRDQARLHAHALLEKLGIGEAANQYPSDVPLGYLKRTEMARAMALKPKVLLLDEPLAGLNNIEAQQLADTIQALNRSGLSIILIEHNLGEVLRICSRLMVLDNGCVLANGMPGEVIKQESVQNAYLGKRQAEEALSA